MRVWVHNATCKTDLQVVFFLQVLDADLIEREIKTLVVKVCVFIILCGCIWFMNAVIFLFCFCICLQHLPQPLLVFLQIFRTCLCDGLVGRFY